MRKLFTLFLTVALLLTLAPAAMAASTAASAAWLNTSELENGVIGVQYKSASGKGLKLVVAKDGTSYTYDLNNAGHEEFFPLQSGSGAYKVTVLENTSGNKYRSIYSQTVSLKLKDASLVYLNSVQNVNWTEAEKTVAKALELTGSLKTDKAKVQAIYDYVIKTVKYDNELAKTVKAGYIPDIDAVLASRKGICYDYASLFAAMARSVGIPAKLLMGQADDVEQYHAWNEVYLDGKWITVDTTVDAVKGNGSFAKDAAKYAAAKIY